MEIDLVMRSKCVEYCTGNLTISTRAAKSFEINTTSMTGEFRDVDAVIWKEFLVSEMVGEEVALTVDPRANSKDVLQYVKVLSSWVGP